MTTEGSPMGGRDPLLPPLALFDISYPPTHMFSSLGGWAVCFQPFGQMEAEVIAIPDTEGFGSAGCECKELMSLLSMPAASRSACY